MKPSIKPPIKLGIKKTVRNMLLDLIFEVTMRAKLNPIILITTIAATENLIVNQNVSRNPLSVNKSI
ncbi:hypothetical protein LIT26_02535 [Peribacillus frigoritolerans]|nr:hypothetical protein LIT26_02535 [Peribacillus frigoritolerans]